MKKFTGLFFIILITFQSFSQNLVQWRGENRDGIYNEKDLLKEWPAVGPKLLWYYDGLKRGHTSVTVTDEMIYTTGEESGEGYIHALDLNGKLQWKSGYGKEWTESFPGTRTSPTFYQDKLYFLSAYGVALCFDAKTGKKIWSVDLMKEFGGKNIKWGFVEAPLIYDNKVIFTPGGPEIMLVALNPQVGATIWTSKGNGNTSAYCSPQLYEHNGKKYIVTATSNHLVGFNADTGEKAWDFSQTNTYAVHPNTPIYKDGYIVSSTGYGSGTTMLKLSEDGNSVSKVWHNENLDNQMGGIIWMNDHIIGSGQNNRSWQCLNSKTGEVLFSTSDLGKGNIIFADELFYCYSDKGELGLMNITSTGFQLISKYRISMGSEQHWAHPVISNGIMYIRHGNTLMAYDIKKN